MARTMGKNAAHQAAKSARGADAEEDAPGTAATGDGVDASFHTKAWHQARLATNEIRRETFEEFKARRAAEESEIHSLAEAVDDAESAHCCPLLVCVS